MKKLIFLFAILVLIIFSGCNMFQKDSAEADVPEEPVVEATIPLIHTLMAPDSSFTIDLPGEPEYSMEEVETEVGILQNNMYIYEYSYTLAYMIAYSDYPKDHIEKYDADELLQNSMNGFVGEIGMEIENNEKIKIKKHAGIEFVAAGGGYWAHMRDYLVDNRLYQIGLLSTAEAINEADAAAYLNSFKLK